MNSFRISSPRPIQSVVSKDCSVRILSQETLQHQYQLKLEQYVKEIKLEKELLEKEYRLRLEEQQEQLRKEFQQELEKQVNLAFEDGRIKGVEEGREIRTRELKAEVDLMAQMSQQLQTAKADILNRAEEDVMRLAVSIARKIIQVEPQFNSDVVRKVIRVALEKMVDKSWVNIHLNPLDIRQVESELTDIIAAFKDLSKVALQEDAAVGRGGCLIETRSGFIDARLETQMQKISDTLFAAIKKRSGLDEIENKR